MPHKECLGILLPVLKIGSSQVVDVLDNGAMPRRVERLHNIEEIMEERDKKFKEITEQREEDDE